jgi:hypothetical protein
MWVLLTGWTRANYSKIEPDCGLGQIASCQTDIYGLVSCGCQL